MQCLREFQYRETVISRIVHSPDHNTYTNGPHVTTLQTTHRYGFVHGRWQVKTRVATGERGVAYRSCYASPRRSSGGEVVSERTRYPRKMYVSCSNRVRHGGYPTAPCRQIFYQVGRGKDKYVIGTYTYDVCVHFSRETQKKKKNNKIK